MDSMKSKVIFYREKHYEPRCLAWMKELREHNKTKKVYDVDPYVEVYQFRDNVYALLTDNLDGGYNSWMYLVDGPEKALLVDTSYGLGDLKGLVDEITGGKEIIVVNTHKSFDHSYGNCRFDKAYCHEYSVPYMERQQNPHIWDYLFDENGKNIWVEFDREDLPIKNFKRFEVIGVPDGYTWDLGDGHEIELIWLPGHQPGHCGFLDKKERILFCGDGFIAMRIGIGGAKPGEPFAEYGTVEAYRDQIEKLIPRLGEFDSLFPGHFIVDIGTEGVTSMLEACNRALENPNGEDFDCVMSKGRIIKANYVEGLGILGYDDNCLYKASRQVKEAE
ncbi:MAG: MBL fold metallo-hydrolase [Oscillospiraceae bacterium]